MSKRVLNITPKKQNRLKLEYDDLKIVNPLTINQNKFFNAYQEDKRFIISSGFPGTGKTFISLYKALEEALDKSKKCNNVIIVRSAVPSRDIGALPGGIDEKMNPYELPYMNMCQELFGKYDAYNRLKEQRILSFISSSYLRGVTWDNTIVVVDEFQNMNEHECHSIITRLGNNSKILFCGDISQTDLNARKEKTCFDMLLRISEYMKCSFHIDFDSDKDIVRGSLVRDYILAKLRSEGKL